MAKQKVTKIFLILIIVILVLIFCWQFFIKDSIIKETGEAYLSWNPSVEKDLKGYKIYYGENPRTKDCPTGGYKNKIDVGNVTSYKINKLESNKTYYFSVTSYSESQKESCFSEEMHKSIKTTLKDKLKLLFISKK